MKKGLKLYHYLNAPSIASLKVCSRQNMAGNVPISYSNIDLGEKRFKLDVTKVKVKEIRPNLLVVSDQDINKLPA